MFEMCTEKGNTPASLPKGVRTSRLLHGTGATGTSGRVLSSDDFCASLTVMKHAFTLFHALLAGTHPLTKHKTQNTNHALQLTFLLQSLVMAH
jgi:hypothetical protein